ncbi:hypothetical protein ADU90_03385 [Clostridium botulinum]|uniref:Uncharacterized protein n=2 Tax=Clostridium botulinum TaxID=1491 RepID=A0A0A0ICU7_CLOBO|nr:hypothetical protein [Clostridium botulinum]KEI04900.1 hypothetical protein Z952_06060 [Clostridium botulinum C/D str. BKT75002]KEI08715.1 hypothetical protein Z954_00920 [Clostridium botulinum C/D str. BKT2873]KGM95768.1 hypothetical protein Z956_03930 [Clostridium botulinum D str. CCUG 7971]KGM98368.1 hypothetical protein Z955_11470 [Clostridium botulinum C/D str. DC5]KOC48108.1 hypothetical protein ADU88_08925 [Clostridium botulinum]
MNISTSSYVKVTNNGAFFASFDVIYLLEGQVYTATSSEFGAGVTRIINIPSGATNITVKIEIAEFIGVWSTLLTKIYQTTGEYCFQTSGTTLSPSCKEVTCGTGDNGSNGNQQSCCCCCCCCPCSTQSSNINTCNNPCSMTSYDCGNDYYSMDPCSSMNSCCTDYTMTPCSAMNSYCTDYTNNMNTSVMNSYSGCNYGC